MISVWITNKHRKATGAEKKDSSLRLAVGMNQSAYADFTLQSRETNDYTHFYIVYI